MISISDYRIPIFIWAVDPDEKTVQQAINLSNLSVTFHHIANMADMHLGYGMPIGGVCACKDAIIPYGVGNDIGCGMRLFITNIPVSSLDQRTLIAIQNKIKQKIPVGYKHHPKPQEWEGFNRAPDIRVIQNELESAKRQLGTLGSGNHFIELQESYPDGRLAIMLHSGSRNFGYKICKEYHTVAMRVCQERMRDSNLAYLRTDKPQGQEYIESMNFALEFAKANRELMMRRIKEVLKKEIHGIKLICEVDVHHNYATLEEHFGKHVWIHRKGATSAKKLEAGIIPGSQGSFSYLVQGLGNELSFESCSHGAGRKMGRMAASKSKENGGLDIEEETKKMDGIIFDGWGTNRKGNTDLGEAPGAYKDIDQVMEAQKDLVKVLAKFKPLVSIKTKEKWKNKKKIVEENDYTKVEV